MRRRTLLVLAGLIAVIGAAVVLALGPAGGALTERWVSDTPRDNRINHHGIGVGPDDRVVVAPVAEVPRPNLDQNLTDTSCTLARLEPESGDVRWRTTHPPERCFSHALTEPAIADVDGDGRLEVAVATTEHALVVYDARTGAEQSRTPLTSYGYGRPTAADVLPAPGTEIVASDIQGGVVVTYGNGTVAWRANLSGGVWAPPVVDDVDGDEEPEVLVETGDGPVLLDARGAVEWRANTSAGATSVAVAQADDDPALEVFVAATGTVHSFDGADGATEWERDVFGSPHLRVASDGDDDGTPELYLGVPDGTVQAVNAETGTTEWTTEVTAGETVVPAPVLGDIDGGDDPEVVAVTETGTVVVLDPASGDELAAYERDVPIRVHATTADVDGDEADEILVRYGDGRVVALEYSE